MKVVLDACVLYPPVLRNILLGAASDGLFEPLFSDRILREWVLATGKLGPDQVALADLSATRLRAAFPRGVVREQPDIEARLVLPDPNDIHVLAVAIAGHADAILTYNVKDFPGHVLAAEGIARRDPDGFLWEMFSRHPARMGTVLEEVRAQSEAMAGEPVSMKAMLKKARLNRLAKAVLA
jgi:predicted nucleic acid-binding protein